MKKLLLLLIFGMFLIVATLNVSAELYESSSYWINLTIYDIVPYWYGNAVNETYYSVYSNLNESFDTTDLKVFPRTMGRAIYGFATAYNQSSNYTYYSLCQNASNFMIEYVWDDNYGGWLEDYFYDNGTQWGISNTKSSYDQFSTVTGIAQCAWVTQNSTILDYAERTYDFYEVAWNTSVGGYANRLNQSGSITDGDYNFGSMIDGATSYLISLHNQTNNQTYLDRLINIADLTIANMIDPTYGVIRETFYSNWTYKEGGDKIYTDHNLKYSWFLSRMYVLTGNETYLNTSKSVFANITTYGWDSTNYGWYDAYHRNNGTLVNTNKGFYHQEEGALASLLLYNLTSDSSYYDYFNKTANFYNRTFIDGTYGGIYSNSNETGDEITNGNKGSSYKSFYHSTEFGLFAERYLDGLFTEPWGLLITDTSSPIITLISPGDNTEDSDGIVTFEYSVSDDSDVDNCTINLKATDIIGTDYQNDLSITKSTTQSFTFTNIIKSNVLEWYINCTDNLNNIGGSSIRTLDTHVGSDPPISPSQGGGGAGSVEEHICKRIFLFILDTNWNFNETDLNNSNLTGGDIEEYPINCELIGFNKLPEKPKEPEPEIIFFGSEECSPDLENSFFDWTFPPRLLKLKIHLGELECKNINRLRWFFTFEEENSYSFRGIRFYLLLILGFLIFIWKTHTINKVFSPIMEKLKKEKGYTNIHRENA